LQVVAEAVHLTVVVVAQVVIERLPVTPLTQDPQLPLLLVVEAQVEIVPAVVPVQTEKIPFLE
jgi:hypothetical protein